MTIRLTRRGRALLLFLSASGYTAWFSGLGERSDAAGDLSSPAVASTPRFSLTPHDATAIRRDPFAGAPDQPVATASASTTPSVPDASSLGPDLIAKGDTTNDPGALDVPNIGDGGAESQPVSLTVRATIVGDTPVAYVENGGTMDIVRIGDTLANERVAAIDLRGLRFADGARLDLPDAIPPPPLPAKASASLSQRIDEIRKLLLAHKPDDSPRARSMPSLAPAIVDTATPVFPTPAPLRTVDARGIAAGTNPTPDAGGPTPFPDPYPYAPAR